MRNIKIGKRLIKEEYPALIIAEISANHGQSLNEAVKLIRKAKECGADAVKFQAYTPDTLTINVDNKYFRIKHPEWGGQTLYQLYKKAYTPWHWFKKLKKIADNLGVIFFATAFDRTAVDFLEEIDVPLHKVASFELVDLPLIRYMAKTGKPLIMSVGIASAIEIGDAINAARDAGARDIILLKCVSSYPAEPEDMHLRTIEDMRNRFKCYVGLSDHTLGIGVSIAGVCLGAVIIEKHFTLSRSKKTPDSFFSLEPKELKELVCNVRVAEKSITGVSYGMTKGEENSLIFRRSLFVVKDIKKGKIFTEDNVRSIRPSYGIKPKYMERVIGKRAKKDIKSGTPLRFEWVDEGR